MSENAGKQRPLSPWVEKWHWKFQTYHPGLAPVLPAAKRFLSDILTGATEPHWFTLLGPSGIGKTLILKRIMKFLTVNDFLWEIPTETGTRFGQIAHIVPAEDLTDWEAPRHYGKYDLIYVEDIGAGGTADKGSGAVLSSRIAELLQLRTGRWTMLDGNLSRKVIAEQLDSRIASRLKRDGSVLLELPSSIPDFNDRKP